MINFLKLPDRAWVFQAAIAVINLGFNNPIPSQESNYIVAFRGIDPPSNWSIPSSQANFFAPSEHRQQQFLLERRYWSEQGISQLNFLTSLTMASENLNDRAKSLQTLATQLNWASAGEEPVLSSSHHASIAEVQFSSASDAQELLSKWQQDGLIWFAEPNGVSQLHRATNEEIFSSEAKIDEFSKLYREQNRWWFNSIQLPEAFDSLSKPSTNDNSSDINAEAPVIAVLDSGLDYEHPALKNRIWTNNSPNASGCDDDLHGCDTTNPRRGRLGVGTIYPLGTHGPDEPCEALDQNCTHGTHVAGIIAGDPTWLPSSGEAPIGGTCPICKIMMIKIVSKTTDSKNGPGIFDSSIIRALHYVVSIRKNGLPIARVINASFGKFNRSRTIALLIHQITESNLSLIISSAGNEDTMRREYPAALDDAIAVSAIDQDLHKVNFSNFGTWVDISAPGSLISSTIPGAGVDIKSGTSMAAPFVSGIAGLILYKNPQIDLKELRRRLIETADGSFYSEKFSDGYNYRYYYAHLSGQSGRVPLLGSGVLNAYKALTNSKSPDPIVFAPIQRVKPGCGTIGKPLSLLKSESNSQNLMLLKFGFFIFPLALMTLGSFCRFANSRISRYPHH